MELGQLGSCEPLHGLRELRRIMERLDRKTISRFRIHSEQVSYGKVPKVEDIYFAMSGTEIIIRITLLNKIPNDITSLRNDPLYKRFWEELDLAIKILTEDQEGIILDATKDTDGKSEREILIAMSDELMDSDF